MQSLRNPKWVFLVNTAPVVLLMLLCYGEFSVVHTLLPAASVAQWKLYGGVLALLGTGAVGYAAVQAVRREPLGAWYSVGMLLAYSLWLCLLTTNERELLPWGAVPRWMLPTDPLLMAWTFLMPTLAHALLALVARFTPDDRPHNAAPNILLAVVTPLVWWVVFLILSTFERGFSNSEIPSWLREAGTVLFVAALVAGTLSFFFFLVRALFIITQRRGGFWSETSLIWKVVITILLPLLGLGVNNGLFFGQGFRNESGIFGNFSSPWFYLLAVLNGALLCVPDSARPLPRLLQLLGRSALFGYTFYFFLVFLPFLPLSIPAIILIGTGFLLLAPTLLFVVHVRQLSEDVTVLRVLYSNTVAVAVLLVGLAVMPLVVTVDYWHRRQVLHEALAYVYTPDYAKSSRLDAPALARTLAIIRQNKSRNSDFLFGSHLPYLSTYFNWLVLDNLMLSESKLDDLDRIFAGTDGPVGETAAPTATLANDRGPALRDLHTSSHYDARQQAWVSWVKLEVANRDSTAANQEYHTAIALPPGCWVSDYSLTIGNREERGILAEKRAASWVFAQIVNENSSRDPGLLAYRGPNDLDLRVYPVMGQEPRRTSIQLLHKEPCTLTIDGHSVTLGDSTTAPPVATPVATADSGVVYLSSLAKQQLPLVQRRPYYHFLIDASAKGAAHLADFKQRVAQQLAQPLPNATPARFSLVNAYATPVPAGGNWAEQFLQQPADGGFFLTGGIRRALFEAQQKPTPTYPVLVVVTNNLDNAVLDDDFEDFSSAYPESDVFYVLGPDGQLAAHSLRHQPRRVLGSAPVPGTPAPVRAWPDAAHPRAYLPSAAVADVVLGQPQAVPSAETTPPSPWLTGLLLRGYSQWQSFHPETAERERVPFVKASFRAGILTPFTSFLALENDAQKAALHRKQDETLAANASLDTLEKENPGATAIPIDNGALLLLVAGVLLAGWQLRRMRMAASVR
ncbi:MSEP-CTERM sorting domain-containing protein [Hymenobacter negativus]|uniref:MSEP-CTERM sorting domain-containing protein n=1 Tax=Hymenobacter negativus TaxID=2795026 RepID=A0ABS3QK78_9BACT|nr:MSEP-CTERM sorting domain-containing protein [Hymenobacter negativus]MBO2011644.1 MSEP-CTERM sorting domain-containing protein [Hymenobacter negativus]